VDGGLWMMDHRRMNVDISTWRDLKMLVQTCRAVAGSTLIGR
jgi:hypothetical protein